jgi:hypothetical protein
MDMQIDILQDLLAADNNAEILHPKAAAVAAGPSVIE